MRRLLTTGFVLLALLALPVHRSDAYTSPCGIGTPPVSGVSAGVIAPPTTVPTVPTTVPAFVSQVTKVIVCVYTSPSSRYTVSGETLTFSSIDPAWTWVLTGGTATVCSQAVGGPHYTCHYAGAGTAVDVTPQGDVSVAPSASVCEDRHSWEWPHCTAVLAGVTFDGPGGPTMGAGAYALACDEQVYTTCVPEALGLPSGVWIPLTPYRDEAKRIVNEVCRNICATTSVSTG